MVTVERLIWDEWNVAHIARHDVTPDEVEEFCHGDFWSSETYAGRLRIVGPTAANDLLTVILAPQDGGVFYPVTARPAGRKERRRYRELKGDDS